MKKNANPERPSVIAREFIEEARKKARERGEDFVELVSGEIHKALNWKSRLPLVCNAMHAAMVEGDEIIHTTPSGKSSTISIRYYTAMRLNVSLPNRPLDPIIGCNELPLPAGIEPALKKCRWNRRQAIISGLCFVSAFAGFVWGG